MNLPIQRSHLGNAYHRPALTPTFVRMNNSTGKSLTISVNHFKAKGSKCFEDKQAAAKLKRLKANRNKNKDALDQWRRALQYSKQGRQGHCAQFRTLAASVLAQALAEQSGDKIILGDLNSYPKEDPLLVLTDYKPEQYAYYKLVGSEHSYLEQQLIAPEISKGFGYHDPFSNDNAASWTYSFKALGRLDYILLSSDLLPNLVAKKVWHINTAESRLLAKHKQYINKIMHTDVMFPSSDHDPLFIELK